MSNSLPVHGLQHARLPCSSLSPGVCSYSCPLSRWCHPTISSSVSPFSSCPQSFPASGSFPISRLFASCGQRIGASASVLPINIQGWQVWSCGGKLFEPCFKKMGWAGQWNGKSFGLTNLKGLSLKGDCLKQRNV